tara:strand:+ start:718 stop:1926 length:1209 start_codon:yes stop_codon:yes gene_type:complete
MAIFRKIRTALFGDVNEITNEPPALLSARLQNTSKLNTSTNDLPLDLDPLDFKHFQYPNDLTTTENGHYIKFDIYENQLSRLAQPPQPNNPFDLTLSNAEGEDFKNAALRIEQSKTNKDKKHVANNNEDSGKKSSRGSRLKTIDTILKDTDNINKMRTKFKNLKTIDKINQELDLHSHTHSSSSSASILLYTPSQNKFVTAANYENAETGFLSDFLGGTNLVDSLTTGVTSAVTKLTAAAITTALEVVVPGAGGFGNRTTGVATNPNLEIAFKSVPFRPFNFEYKFAPKNKKELDQVHKIIQLFRFHMSPSLLGRTQYFASPSQFNITYCYRVSENNDESHNSYIPKIAKCVLENLEVDYSPGEKFTTLKPDDQGASPQVITMNLQFKEMSIITKETIAEGY